MSIGSNRSRTIDATGLDILDFEDDSPLLALSNQKRMSLHCDVMDLMWPSLSPEIRPVIDLARQYWLTGGVTKEEMDALSSRCYCHFKEKKTPLHHADHLVWTLFSYEISGSEYRSDNTMYFLDRARWWVTSISDVQAIVRRTIEDFSAEMGKIDPDVGG